MVRRALDLLAYACDRRSMQKPLWGRELCRGHCCAGAWRPAPGSSSPEPAGTVQAWPRLLPALQDAAPATKPISHTLSM